VTGIDVSPDSKSIVFELGTPAYGSWLICALPDCSNRRRFARQLGDGGISRWTPDGRAIAYIRERNIWAQPLDGGPRRQLTHFTDGWAIDDFAWSPDWQRLAVGRRRITNDIVLFKGLRPDAR